MSRNFGPGGPGSEASPPGGRPGRRPRHRAGRDRRGAHGALPPRDRALCRGPRRGERAGAWPPGLGGVGRRGACPCRLQRRGGPVVLPHTRRGRRPHPLLREHPRGERGPLAPRSRGALPRVHRGRLVSARLSGLRRRRARSRARRGYRARGALGAHAPRRRRDRRPRRPRPRPGRDQARAVTIPDSWRLPPVPVLLTAVVLIVCAEVGGASMVRFKLELTRWARQAMLERPGTHGLVGVRDVDERVLDEALVKFDAGLRLFHLHAEGMGLVIIATATVAATLAGSPASRRPIIALLTVGGAGHPLGYLLWGRVIPHYGPDRGETIPGWLLWSPFRGASHGGHP